VCTACIKGWTLLTGEVHVADVERALQKDAVAKGMQIVPSTLSANQVVWYFGGLYFASPDKLNPKVPFVDKRVRQAMNMALNRQAIADNLLLGRAQPARVATYHPELDSTLWPGIWNPAWDQRFEEMYGYNPSRAKALLEEAGYPQGFEFTVYLFPLAGLPEQVDIGQAMALDWQAVGLKPKLVEVDFPRVREHYRTKAIHGAVWGLRGRALAADSIRIINRSQDGVIYAYEHPFIEERLQALGSMLEPGARTRLLREIGDHKFNEFAEMPLFWLFAEAAVNPKVVAEYVFPGSIPGFYTHLEYIKLAP
jgi:peptide/nickel transport system substrate-binding protein